jgi:hypothetical protein
MTVKDRLGMSDDWAMAIGMFSFCGSILVGRFTAFEVAGFSISAFSEGLLSGVALVLVLYSLLKRRRA